MGLREKRDQLRDFDRLALTSYLAPLKVSPSEHPPLAGGQRHGGGGPHGQPHGGAQDQQAAG